VADCHDTVGVFAPNNKPIRLCRRTFLIYLSRIGPIEAVGRADMGILRNREYAY